MDSQSLKRGYYLVEVRAGDIETKTGLFNASGEIYLSSFYNLCSPRLDIMIYFFWKHPLHVITGDIFILFFKQSNYCCLTFCCISELRVNTQVVRTMYQHENIILTVKYG